MSNFATVCSATLTATTYSSDTTKQCTDTTKSKTGSADVILKATYTLTQTLNMSNSQLKLTVPMLYAAYSDASVLGSTSRASMLPSSVAQQYVKVVHSGQDYYASKLAVSFDSGNG